MKFVLQSNYISHLLNIRRDFRSLHSACCYNAHTLDSRSRREMFLAIKITES